MTQPIALRPTRHGLQYSRATKATRHNAIIRHLASCFPSEIRITGFAATLRRMLTDQQAAILEPLITGLRPDAHTVSPAERAIVAIEVEVGHPLREEKVELYGRLHGHLARLGVRLELAIMHLLTLPVPKDATL